MKAVGIWITWQIFQGAQKQKGKPGTSKQTSLPPQFSPMSGTLDFLSWVEISICQISTQLHHKQEAIHFHVGYSITTNPSGKKKWTIILTNLCFWVCKLYIFRPSSVAKPGSWVLWKAVVNTVGTKAYKKRFEQCRYHLKIRKGTQNFLC